MQKKELICNKCGKPLSYQDISGRNHEFNFDFGYASQHDGEKISFDLCSKCLDNVLETLVRTFKHVPDGWRENEYIILNSEEHQKVFENWQKTNSWDELMFYTYEQLEEMNGWLCTEYLNDVIKKYHPEKPLLPIIE